MLKSIMFNINYYLGLKNNKLLESARNGETEKIIELIGQGADINYKNDFGDTALHLAARSGSIETVKELIARHCDINAKNHFTYTPLELSVEKNHSELVKYLIEESKPKITNQGLNKLFDLAVTNNAHETMIALIDLGARISNSCKSPLFIAARYGNIDTFKLLLAMGADISQCDSEGNNVLHIAASYRCTGLVHTIIDEQLINPTLTNYYGQTPSQVIVNRVESVEKNLEYKERKYQNDLNKMKAKKITDVITNTILVGESNSYSLGTKVNVVLDAYERSSNKIDMLEEYHRNDLKYTSKVIDDLFAIQDTLIQAEKGAQHFENNANNNLKRKRDGEFEYGKINKTIKLN